MKAPMRLLICVLFCSMLADAQYPNPNLNPGNPAVPRAPDAEHRLPIDKPAQTKAPTKRRQVDAAETKRQAEELAKLSQAIPPEIDLVAKGQLPKDLNERLKRIEKLSKQLRRELLQ